MAPFFLDWCHQMLQRLLLMEPKHADGSEKKKVHSSLRMTQAEHVQLQELSDVMDMSINDVLRHLIAQAHEALPKLQRLKNNVVASKGKLDAEKKKILEKLHAQARF